METFGAASVERHPSYAEWKDTEYILVINMSEQHVGKVGRECVGRLRSGNTQTDCITILSVAKLSFWNRRADPTVVQTLEAENKIRYLKQGRKEKHRERLIKISTR